MVSPREGPDERNVVVGLVAAVDLSEHVIPRVFVAMAAVIVAARLMGALARRLRQPPVVGEIIGGIALGPTLLGLFPGRLDQLLFPTDIRPFLTVIANLGLIIFMFIVGLELDTTLIRGKERIAGVISISSILLPMTMGLILAQALYASYAGPGIGAGAGDHIARLPFGLFIGSAMSITAFPVLARILVDRGMYRTALGSLTLASAAVDDILAWALLAVVLAVVRTGTFLSWDFPRVLGLSLAFGAVMWLVVRPNLARLVPAYERLGRLTPNLASVVLIGFLLSSFVTARIGIHHILGAFAFGAVMPRERAHGLTLELLERLEQISVLLLLPVFFVTTGLNVNISSLSLKAVGVLLVVLAVACAGKFVGATAAARLQGIGLRRAAAIGTLMNTRGLTELIVLTVGRENGVLNDELFTIMVVMAVVTTVITEPALRLFYPDELLARDVAEAERVSLGVQEAYRVVLVVDDPPTAGTAAQVAAAIARADHPAEVILSRLVPPGPAPELGAGLSAQLLEMTGAMEAMAALERQTADSGVTCNVITRFGHASGAELAAHVSGLGPDVVVITDPRLDLTVLARASGVLVARLRQEPGAPGAPDGGARDGRPTDPTGSSGSTGNGVLVVVDDGDAAGALVDLGLRLAADHGRGQPVTVAAGGRLARRLNRLDDLTTPAGTRVARVVSPEQAAQGRPWSLIVASAGAGLGAGSVRSETRSAAADNGAAPPSASPAALFLEVAVATPADFDDVYRHWVSRLEGSTSDRSTNGRSTTEHPPSGEKAGQA